jgi:hypothetical protein
MFGNLKLLMLLHVQMRNRNDIEEMIVRKMPALQVLMITDEKMIVDPSIFLASASLTRIILDKYQHRWEVLAGSRIVVEGFSWWDVYTMPW